jgi:hypothetical protein
MTTPVFTADSAPTWLSREEERRYAARWEEIQAGFVGDPRGALERADQLVADVLERVTARYAEERRALHGRWDPAETPTESLRTSLQSYRDMFEALLA